VLEQHCGIYVYVTFNVLLFVVEHLSQASYNRLKKIPLYRDHKETANSADLTAPLHEMHQEIYFEREEKNTGSGGRHEIFVL
jgi:hypothetical protein